MDILACKEMSCLDVDAPKAEKTVGSEHLDDVRIGNADVGAGLFCLVNDGLFEVKRHDSPRSRDDVPTLFRFLS
ncbi:hypothetical protein LZK80_18865 [Rhizobium leguminosarum]|nr:hypothetical protein LZK80_18865 [Rhizobium leguminosarum]